MWRSLVTSLCRGAPAQVRREAGPAFLRQTWPQRLPAITSTSYAFQPEAPTGPSGFFRNPSARSAARKAFDDQVETLSIQDKETPTIAVPNSIMDEILNGLEPSEEEKERANKLFHWDVEFQQSVTRVEDIKGYGPQVAFVGRSNVGKSRLVNSLCYNKHLARVSRTPGLTQTINLFGLASYGTGDRRYSHVRLVDLPGYGFAKRAKEVRASFGPMIKNYVAKCPELVRVFILVDSVVGMTELDLEMAKLCQEHGRVYQIVLTKADKTRFILPAVEGVKRRLANQRAEMTRFPFIPVTSSLKNWHIDTVRAFVIESADSAMRSQPSEEVRLELEKIRQQQYPDLPEQPMQGYQEQRIKLDAELKATEEQKRQSSGGQDPAAQPQQVRNSGRETELAKRLREQAERAREIKKASSPVHQASIPRPKKPFKVRKPNMMKVVKGKGGKGR